MSPTENLLPDDDKPLPVLVHLAPGGAVVFGMLRCSPATALKLSGARVLSNYTDLHSVTWMAMHGPPRSAGDGFYEVGPTVADLLIYKSSIVAIVPCSEGAMHLWQEAPARAGSDAAKLVAP